MNASTKGSRNPLIHVPLLGFLILGLFSSTALAGSDCDRAYAIRTRAMMAREKSQAKADLQEAIRLCPGDIRPYELLGNLHRQEKDYDKAIALFTTAAELGSANHKLYYWLAFLTMEKGDLNQAHHYLAKSLSLNWTYRPALALKVKLSGAADTAGPVIRLFELQPQAENKVGPERETLSLRGVVTDRSGVAWLKVNNLEAALEDDGRFLKDVPLKTGVNRIDLEAADQAGNRSALSLTVARESQPAKVGSADPSKRFYRKSYAVVVGVNGYEKCPALEFAVPDALAIKAKFEQTGFDEITVILDKEATQRRILTELYEELPKKVQMEDRVVFYFAGHGQTQELPGGGAKGFILPVDAGMDDFTATAISMEQIRGLSSRLPAKHILFAMDSCYSGLGLSRAGGLSARTEGYLRKVASLRVVQIITAGGKGEQVQEKEGHGLFTATLLAALDGEADLDRDGVITGTELGAFLRPTVSNASNHFQTPLFGRLEGEGEILFFLKRK
ncbi:MAG: caspase family protein [Thermodesulfobacteriota bacterium]